MCVFLLQSVNIFNRDAQQMIRSWEVEKQNVEKYRKSLEESNRDQVAAMDRVKELERKVLIWMGECGFNRDQ